MSSTLPPTKPVGKIESAGVNDKRGGSSWQRLGSFIANTFKSLVSSRKRPRVDDDTPEEHKSDGHNQCGPSRESPSALVKPARRRSNTMLNNKNVIRNGYSRRSTSDNAAAAGAVLLDIEACLPSYGLYMDTFPGPPPASHTIDSAAVRSRLSLGSIRSAADQPQPPSIRRRASGPASALWPGPSTRVDEAEWRRRVDDLQMRNDMLTSACLHSLHFNGGAETGHHPVMAVERSPIMRFSRGIEKIMTKKQSWRHRSLAVDDTPILGIPTLGQGAATEQNRPNKEYTLDEYRHAAEQSAASEGYIVKMEEFEKKKTDLQEHYDKLKTQELSLRSKEEKRAPEVAVEPSADHSAPRRPSWMLLTEEERMDARALLCRTGSELLAPKQYNIDITAHSLSCLQQGRWLNDEVVNYYFMMLQDRSDRSQGKLPRTFLWNSFFWQKLSSNASGAYSYKSVARWSKRRHADIFSFERMIVPIHVGKTHWALGVVDLKECTLSYYDSLGASHPKFYDYISRYIEDEHKDKNSHTPLRKPSEWQRRDAVITPTCIVPRQNNSNDCGVFMCMFAEAVSGGSRSRVVLAPLAAPLAAAAAAVMVGRTSKLALAEEKDAPQIDGKPRDHGRGQVVWMFGDRSCIPYGAGSDLTRPTPIEWFSLHDCMWKQVALGKRFGAARDEKGRVYVWGQKKVAELPEADKRRLRRMELPIPEGAYVPPLLLKSLQGHEAVDLQISEDRVFVLTSRGRVVTWSIEDLLNSADDSETTAVASIQPTEFEGLPTIKWWWVPRGWGNAIRCMSVGRRHAGFIDDYGHTYMVGDNTFGQCGRKIKAKNVNPEDGTLMPIQESREPPEWFKDPAKPLLSVPGKASQVSCGGRHTMVLGEDGRVWAFGDDSRIQLALGDTRSKPQDMMGPGKRGWQSIYNMGDEKMHRLEDNNPHAPRVQYSYYDPHCQWRPKLTQQPPPRSGKPFTSPLWVHLGNKISVFCHEDEPDWASKRPPEESQEGLSILDEEKARRSKDVECNILFACGENLYGECGRNTQRHQQALYPVRLPKFTKVEEVRCGSHHCLCRLVDGTVYTWGKNQHGQGGVGNRATICPPAAVLGSRQRGPLRRDVETNNSAARREAQAEAKHVSDTSYIPFDEKDMIPVPEPQTWQQKLESWMADMKHMFITEPSMPELEKESKPSEHTGILERSQLTTEEQLPWRPIHVAAGGNGSAIIAVWEQSVADAIFEERERQKQENAALLLQQMAELEKRKEALAAGVLDSTTTSRSSDTSDP
ncbi:hypothetical protein FOZ61_006669 [Perkinsus olseni]|uniref:Ubiquitin-like protease family profile domain-containing protein n=1 Tax=Perkinsus olseni TaxID=32597 RepID=A0A7J6LC12_PEROL|nr:hypothetical protein FOZ61_006669 [Perkinsus olseni]